MLYPEVRLQNLLTSHSDHSPILLQTSVTTRTNRTYSFKFENIWLKEEDVGDVVEEGWGGNRELDITGRVARCADQLQDWGRRKRMRFKQEVNECSEEMERLRGRHDPDIFQRYKETQEKHARLLVQEETYWRQRAKMHWLQQGDLNTRFFHTSASIRSKAKKIEKLINSDNIEVKTQL
jgi:hypothetical protein